MTGKPRGRPRGPGKKRKAETELSTNPNTKRDRDRKASLSEEQWWRRVKKKLFQEDHYQNADEATRASLEEAAFQEHSTKYMSLGKHPNQLKVGASPSGTIGGIAEDNENPV